MGGGGGGDARIKMTGVLVGNFEKNPQKVPESRLVGVAQIHFLPYEVPGVPSVLKNYK